MSDSTDEQLYGKLRRLSDGGLFVDLSNHVVALVPQGSRKLVVTFDNLASRRITEDCMPWGYDVLSRAGWDVMGVLSKRPNWFRCADLKDTFDVLKAEGVFSRYDQVAFYGASMGAFGALAFAPVSPGCTIVAMAPQSTLNRKLAPFETRYRFGRSLGDWDDPRYRDGAEGMAEAQQVYVMYDPLVPLDDAHARRLTGQHVTHIRLHGTGHKIPPALQKMKILKPVALDALEGRLTPPQFRKLFRARHGSIPWVISLLERAQCRGQQKIALNAGEFALKHTPNWKIRKFVKKLRLAQAA